MLKFHVGQLIESVRIIACVVSVLLHFGRFSIYETRDQIYPDHSLYFPASSKRFVGFLLL